MRLWIGAMIFPALVACATGPTKPLAEQYTRQNWAAVSVEQAEAECYAFINSAAAGYQNLYLCMKGKGYIEKGMEGR